MTEAAAPGRSPSRLADGAAVAGIVAAACAVSWWLRLPWFYANFLFLGLPLAYVLVRSERTRRNLHAKFIAKLVLFAAVAYDSLCQRYAGWSSATIFPFTLPAGVVVEEIQWLALYFPLVLAVNEHFFTANRMTPPRRALRTVMATGFFVGLAVGIIGVLHRPFAAFVYVKLGLLFQVPVMGLALWANRWVLRELLLITVATAPANLLIELLALQNGYWAFPGDYLGMVTVAGYVFPWEEMIFLVVLSAPSLVATYALYKNWKRVGASHPGGAHRALDRRRAGEPIPREVHTPALAAGERHDATHQPGCGDDRRIPPRAHAGPRRRRQRGHQRARILRQRIQRCIVTVVEQLTAPPAHGEHGEHVVRRRDESRHAASAQRRHADEAMTAGTAVRHRWGSEVQRRVVAKKREHARLISNRFQVLLVLLRHGR